MKPRLARTGSRRAAALALLVSFVAAAAAMAQSAGGDIRNVRIGLTADAMPDGLYDPACGTNGGPPSTLIDGFENFAECPAEPNGLHEVYIVFDDELAQFARANPELQLEWVEKFSGTIVAGFPVILSVLFDEAGIVRMVRAVTDPRAGVDKRSEAYLFRIPIQRRFGLDGWECEPIARGEGETEIGGIFIKQRCIKRFPDRTMTIESRFYRKPGQTGRDVQGQFEPGSYESSTRFEILDASLPVPPLPER